MPAALAQAILPILGALLTLAACCSLGLALMTLCRLPATRLETYPFSLVLGAGVLHLANFAVMAAKVAYTPVLVGILLASLSIGAAAWIKAKAAQSKPADAGGTRLAPLVRFGLGVIAAVYFIYDLANAWAPELSYDGSGYHLGLIARYLRAHGFEAVPTNFYSSLSEGLEMLFVPAFAIGRHSAAALVHFGFLIALGMATMAYGYRIGKPLAGACAALLVCLAPIAAVDGTSAYVDAAAAAAAFIVFYLTQIWDQRRDNRLLILIGLAAGYCCAVKYTLVVMLIYAAVFVWWRQRQFRPILVLAATASVMILPWMIKNWIYLDNPIAPFGNTLFRNPFIHPEFERLWLHRLRNYSLANPWMWPLEVTIHGELLGGALGPVFLAAPLALLGLRRPEVRRLLAPVVLLLPAYFGNVGTRFLIPVLPFVALAMSLALERVTLVLILLVAGHAVVSWPRVLPRYSHAWALLRMPSKAALRMISEENYLGARWEYQVARMVEGNVPAGGRVFAFNGLPDAYTSREILVAYQGALNEVLEDALGVAAYDIYRPQRVWVFRFPSRTVRGLRVVQTAAIPKAEEQWSVHEMRVLSHGAELAREARWRLAAFPNPWDVTMAFDNSEATRWRTWETASPGNYIGVDFGSAKTVDELRLETSPDDWDVKFRVESLDAQGRWEPVDAQFEERRMTYDGSLKKAATYELHARGVDYLIIRDTDWGGPIFSADPESWGLQVIARTGTPTDRNGPSATLYRVDPRAYHIDPQVKP